MLNFKLNFKHFIINFFLLINLTAYSQDIWGEKILSFNSNITLHKDASMDVEETIKVYAKGFAIKRGIYREFPTTYFDKYGNKYTVDFEVIEIIRNGKPEPYRITNASNGKIIYIGNKNSYISPGTHTYIIKYKTNRLVGFFKEHDELFWNVTGNGWIFPIIHASAVVTLPADIPLNKIKLDGYTGVFNSQDKNFKYNIKDNKIFFETTKPLQPYEGLSIVIGWPKNFINEPGLLTRIWYFLKDNIITFWLLFWTLFVFIYYIIIWLRVKKENPEQTIIPLFEAPENLTPGAVRYIHKMKYDNKSFTAEILNMAIKGNLKIAKENSKYKLIKNNPITNNLYSSLWQKMFSKKEEFILDNSNQPIIANCIETLKAEYETKYLDKYFVENKKHLWIGIGLSILTFIPIMFNIDLLNITSIALISGIAFFVLFLTNLTFSSLMFQYS